jgi:RNA polymerase sigma-70 factor (sigma-E family)
VSDDKHRELADCYAAEARDLFGYACILTRGEKAQAGDLVHGAFEAASRAWPVVRGLNEEQRCAWLRGTLVTSAISGFHTEATLPDRLPHLEGCRRKTQAEPAEQAFPADVLERCWQTIQDLPEWPHAVALLRWHLDMKEVEIAAALGKADQTVSRDLDRARHRLIAELEPDDQDSGDPGDDPDHDGLLARLYQEVTALQEARFGDGYDLVAGLERYQAWLREERGADDAVYALYAEHYKSLVRLAAMLVRDTPTAEEVVQDAFVAMHGGWHRLEDTEKALAYLRQAVVNKSRSVLRHRVVVEKNLQGAPPDMPSAEHGAFAMLERDAVIKALRNLPERQREAIVLRYYADLSEADIAAAMRISRGAVKSHTARGMAALRGALEGE